MRAAFIKNKYYTDSGVEYVCARLCAELNKRGIQTETPRLFAAYPCAQELGYDFAVFWDKDVRLARMLERGGVRLFNRAETVEVCDDKERTYASLEGSGVPVPPTVAAPLVYDVGEEPDGRFLREVAEKLGFPLVVKENTGSQGRQVWLAQDFGSLTALAKTELHTPHLYQKFVPGKRGSDVRVYVVGGKAVAAAERTNTTDFKSNVCQGGKMTLVPLSPSLADLARRVSDRLKCDYVSADFILSAAGPVFIEANSNAYFRSVENLGVDIAGRYADYIVSQMQC